MPNLQLGTNDSHHMIFFNMCLLKSSFNNNTPFNLTYYRWSSVSATPQTPVHTGGGNANAGMLTVSR